MVYISNIDFEFLKKKKKYNSYFNICLKLCSASTISLRSVKHIVVIDMMRCNRQSYKPVGQLQCERRLASAPAVSVWPRAGPDERLARLTTHKASFPGWPGAERPPPTLPDDHEMGGGRGPMQAVTSQRHDYVSKAMPANVRGRAASTIVRLGDYGGGGGCPVMMASATTTAEAFAAGTSTVAGRRPSVRPPTADRWSLVSCGQMAADTETSRSYVPRAAVAAASIRRPTTAYCRPADPVNGCTVYTGSYRPPGEYRDPLPGERPPPHRYRGFYATEDDDNALAADGRPFYPRAHDYNLCRRY